MDNLDKYQHSISQSDKINLYWLKTQKFDTIKPKANKVENFASKTYLNNI